MDYTKLITVMITTHPIPVHPSTAMIAEVYESVRYHLGDGIPTVVMCDGVEDRRVAVKPQYEEYKRNLKALNWPNTEIMEFAGYENQLEMARQAFKQNKVKTPLILWMEHDRPLLPAPIEWDKILQTLLVDREMAVIRFSETPGGPVCQEIGPCTAKSGIPLLRTTEFFSCPNLAWREFYEGVFSICPSGHIYFENVARGFAESIRGRAFPIAHYNPPGNRQRSTHLDGSEKERPEVWPRPPMDVHPAFHQNCNYSEAGIPVNLPLKWYL